MLLKTTNMNHFHCGLDANVEEETIDLDFVNRSNVFAANVANYFGESEIDVIGSTDACKNSLIFLNPDNNVHNNLLISNNFIHDSTNQFQKYGLSNSWLLQEPLYGGYSNYEVLNDQSDRHFETKLNQQEVPSPEELSAPAVDCSSNINQFLSNLDQEKNYFYKNVSHIPNLAILSNMNNNINSDIIEQSNQYGINLFNSFLNKSSNASTVPNELIKNNCYSNCIVDIPNNSKIVYSNAPNTENNNSSSTNYTDKLSMNLKTPCELKNIHSLPKKNSIKRTESTCTKINKNDFKNCTKLSLPDLTKNHWTPVFPRQIFTKIPEMIVMHPLHTRKIVPVQNTEINNCNDVSLDLDKSRSSIRESNKPGCYTPNLDNVRINIPTPQKHSTSKITNKYRRKQKLCIIPGSEEFIFEVLQIDNEGTFTTSKSNNIQDPYPETELPELNIFQRKKMISTISASSDKKINQMCQENCNSNKPIGIHKRNLNKTIEKGDLSFFSDSDSADSNLNGDGNSKHNSSHKCLQCKKFFKSNRFLTIHKKRCANRVKENNHKIIGDKHWKKTITTSLTDKSLMENEEQSYITTKSNNTIIHTPPNIADKTLHTSIKNSLGNKINNLRPVTRSQARRSTRY